MKYTNKIFALAQKYHKYSSDLNTPQEYEEYISPDFINQPNYNKVLFEINDIITEIEPALIKLNHLAKQISHVNFEKNPTQDQLKIGHIAFGIIKSINLLLNCKK